MQRVSFLIFCYLIWLTVYGAPARPGIHKYKQPTGEVVKIEIRGDENFHYRVSEDGYILTELQDTLFFLSRIDNDEMCASPFMAVNPEKRSAECIDFLMRQDKSIVKAEFQKMYSNRHVKDNKRITTNGDISFGLFGDASYPRFGKQKALVILVEYPDIKFNGDYNANDYFFRMLNDEDFHDYNADGSVRMFFEENSRGKFLPEFDVYGPVELPKPSYFYGSNNMYGKDINAARMIADACKALDEAIDYTQYDRDNDGLIDNVFVFYAGRGEASGGAASTIWPHSWDVRYGIDESIILDGKILGRYACTNEWQGNKPDGIGTFVHEFSHVLGLPDLYATSYTDAFTPGEWSVMDYGSYNNDSRTPPMFSSFERYALGWSDASVLCGIVNIELSDMYEADGYVVETGCSSEKYFIENRQQTGWDRYIPGRGMVVWHVNYDENVWAANVVNDDPEKQYIDLIEADRNEDEAKRSSHSFPGALNVDSMSFVSHPESCAWNDSEFFLTINDIKENEGVITALIETVGKTLDIPEGLFVSDISEDSFTAHWNKVDGATDYRLSVFTIRGGGINVETNGFDSGLSDMRGWSTSAITTSSTSENVGMNEPSLMFSIFGGNIDTPEYLSDIEQFSFWCRTYSSANPAVRPEIMLYGRTGADKDQKLIETISVAVNEPGRVITVDNIPDGIKSLRLRMVGINGITYYIDDCSVVSRINTVYEPLDGFPVMTGDVDEIVIADMPVGFSGGFVLEATEGENFSRSSEVCMFELYGSSDNIERAYIGNNETDGNIEIYNLQGIRVETHGIVTPGIYIVKSGSVVRKVVL